MPKADLDAEAAVLSAMLMSGEEADNVSHILRSEHFYADANRRIYEAILATRAAKLPADIVTVAHWLRNNGRLEQVGGSEYLAGIIDATPAVTNAVSHARIIRSCYTDRQTLTALREAVAEMMSYGDAATVTKALGEKLRRAKL